MSVRQVLKRAALAAAVLLPWSQPASAWWNHDWSFRKQITLDPAAAGVSGELNNGVVLLRLHEGVFPFADANADGSDLRIVAEDDKTTLKFHIEKLDPVFNLGFIWVQVPKLAAGTPVKLWLYWGNTNAAGEGDAKGSYDADQKLVYHFGENGTPAQDATSFQHHAVSAVAGNDGGLIGGSAKFDGSAVLALPATPSLALPAGGSLTWSAWIKTGATDPEAVIYAQRDAGRSFVVALRSGAPYFGFADGPGPLQESAPAASIADSEWHHLAVVATAAQSTLYVDGEARGQLARGLPVIAGAATLGGQGGVNGAPVEMPFRGEIDEMKLASSARDVAMLRLEAKNQGVADKLVTLGADEVQSSWSTGYVGIIMGSVTLDGWIVIIILMLMMVYSWYLMAVKASQVGQVSKANRVFLDAYELADGDFAVLHQATVPDGKASVRLKLEDEALERMRDSPLTHMFNTGIGELHRRLSSEKRHGRYSDTLSEQSIHAIRAKLDSTLVREMQALNKRMVLLTIAISGGPFIGLLGTVVGVMITFAGVAAAGEVNVNAIAPGISAALAATVAGMAVAIPALFGYNYLTVRIKECVAEMHVFIDAFVTSMAENYNDPAALHAIAD
ncbi:MotA/TolQ/ExbB proton channel family protein [Solimonas sp. K1W22B-7]|uniref:DUF2341 domain-containing protein n=1 Tax=Solimonas sp. K1W22B-7 TaxID=2303331 RepID=UPI000E333047|nr:MotA/TolQ/ExbB proton channel family protein [Solimonas sp. K1W22B-7]AXQ30359.1 MotA/TolQ/ExbB proton channel family protein [Solimonas sp. K1W22B-7]